MCGIIGLHLRDPELHPRLGALLDDMLCGVSERGPDSVGVAVYGDEHRNPPGESAVSVLRAPGDLDVTVGGLFQARDGHTRAVERAGRRVHQGSLPEQEHRADLGGP